MPCLKFAMMRVLTDSNQTFARSSLFAFASVLALAAVQPASAQSSGGGFSLPAPTPTPTSAPQGPADERAGVPIGPRVIRQAAPTPAPTATPTPTPAPAPTSTSTPTRPRAKPTPSAARTPAPTPTPRPSPVIPAPTRTAAAEPGNAGAQGAEVPLGSDLAPGFESFPDEGEELAPVGPTDWYDVSEDEAAGAGGEEYSESESFAVLQEWDSTQNRIAIGIALLVLALGAIAFLAWRRRRREAEVQSTPNTALASGIRRSIADQMPAMLKDAPDWSKGDGPAKKRERAPEPESKAEPAAEPEAPSEPEREPEREPAHEPEREPEREPAPVLNLETELEPAGAPEPAEPAPAPALASKPARIDLELEVVSATRSMMMFTVEFRLDVFNRSDNAVRELSLAAKLTSAQRGTSNAAPLAGGQPIAEIQRIGPHQSQRISGTLQLPLREVTPIMQGSKPLLIPLLHVILEGAGQSAMNRSFVLGTPSAAGTGRVHPLPLDGPPGGLPPLDAQLIRQPSDGDRRSAQTP